MRERLLMQRQALAALMGAIGASVKDARAMMRRMKHLGFEHEVLVMEKISAKAAARAAGKKATARARKTVKKKPAGKKKGSRQ